MKYLKKFESNNNYEDCDTMAMYQLFGSTATFCFQYRGLLINDTEQINDLIKSYTETYTSEKEWSGGPVNKKFDNYFIDNIDNKKNLHSANLLYALRTTNPFKPNIVLIINTDYGQYIIGFNIFTKKINHIFYNVLLLPMDSKIININNLNDYNNNTLSNYKIKVVDEIRKLIVSFNSKSYTITDVVEYLNLKIDEKIEFSA